MGVDTIVNRTVLTTDHLKNVTAPVFLLHGDNDLAYPSSNSVDLKMLLVSEGVKKVDLKIINDAPQSVPTFPPYPPFSNLTILILRTSSFASVHSSKQSVLTSLSCAPLTSSLLKLR